MYSEDNLRKLDKAVNSSDKISGSLREFNRNEDKINDFGFSTVKNFKSGYDFIPNLKSHVLSTKNKEYKAVIFALVSNDNDFIRLKCEDICDITNNNEDYDEWVLTYKTHNLNGTLIINIL